jgi:hypothetical protein
VVRVQQSQHLQALRPWDVEPPKNVLMGVATGEHVFVLAKTPLAVKDPAHRVIALLQIVPSMRCDILPDPADVRFAAVTALETFRPF